MPRRLPPASNLVFVQSPDSAAVLKETTMQWYLVSGLLTVLTGSHAIP
jgi:hypothetical protein